MLSINIGNFIYNKRISNGLSQEQLCHDICCSLSTLSRIERGTHTPSPFIIAQLFERLNVKEEEVQLFLGQKDIMTFQLMEEIVALNIKKEYREALQKINELEKITPKSYILIHQFLLRSRIVAGKENENGEILPYSPAEELEMIQRALSLTRPRLDFNHFKRSAFSLEELKLLNLLADNYSNQGKILEAIDLLRNLYEYLQDESICMEVKKILFPMISYNYSRLLFLENRFQECILIAEKGKEFCVKFNRAHTLGKLMYNLACSNHELGNDSVSIEYLKKSYCFHLIMENYKSCTEVQRYAKENFQIDLFNLFSS